MMTLRTDFSNKTTSLPGCFAVSRARKACCFVFAYLVCFFLAGTPCYAQKKSVTITGEFVDMPARQFIKVLADQTGFRFYYDPSVMDSVKVSISVKDESLEKVLSLAFHDIVHFAIDNEANVFLTRWQEIQLKLPDGFGNALNP